MDGRSRSTGASADAVAEPHETRLRVAGRRAGSLRDSRATGAQAENGKCLWRGCGGDRRSALPRNRGRGPRGSTVQPTVFSPRDGLLDPLAVDLLFSAVQYRSSVRGPAPAPASCSSFPGVQIRFRTPDCFAIDPVQALRAKNGSRQRSTPPTLHKVDYSASSRPSRSYPALPSRSYPATFYFNAFFCIGPLARRLLKSFHLSPTSASRLDPPRRFYLLVPDA